MIELKRRDGKLIGKGEEDLAARAKIREGRASTD